MFYFSIHYYNFIEKQKKELNRHFSQRGELALKMYPSPCRLAATIQIPLSPTKPKKNIWFAKAEISPEKSIHFGFMFIHIFGVSPDNHLKKYFVSIDVPCIRQCSIEFSISSTK